MRFFGNIYAKFIHSSVFILLAITIIEFIYIMMMMMMMMMNLYIQIPFY